MKGFARLGTDVPPARSRLADQDTRPIPAAFGVASDGHGMGCGSRPITIRLGIMIFVCCRMAGFVVSPCHFKILQRRRNTKSLKEFAFLARFQLHFADEREVYH